jgi:starch phosphorylase
MPGLPASVVSLTAYGFNALPRSIPFVRTTFSRIAEHLGRAEMTDVVRTPTESSTELDTAVPASTDERSRTGLSADALRRGIVDHLRYSIGRPAAALRPEHYYRATALAVRDRMQDNRVASTQTSLDLGRKVTCYLSAEFLMGPQLGSNLLNLDIEHHARAALAELGQDLDEVLACEEEPGLGNGGLGRLAACYLDSLATLEYPAIGYGIRYEFGIFDQEIHDGWQVEKTDNWLVNGNPWEIAKPDVSYLVKWGGYAEHYDDDAGHDRARWVPGRVLKGVAYDTPIQGYGAHTCNVLTLWSARAVQSFALDAFNTGDYYKAVEDEVNSETVTKVLYPNDEPEVGKRLRLLQQYFFVSCSLQHVLHIMDDLADLSVRELPQQFALQLNDTHPSIGVAELMRLLVDERGLGWDEAWDITVATFGYTNHTLLPEALEKWPLTMFAESLPRHLEIIYEINRRFLDEVRTKFPNDEDRLRRMSLIGEDGGKSVRMAHLATVGSHAINGVAALHSELLKESVLKDFYEMWPERSPTRPTESRRGGSWLYPTRVCGSCSTTPSARAGCATWTGFAGWRPSPTTRRSGANGVPSSGRTRRASPNTYGRPPVWSSIPTGCSTFRSSAFTSTSANTSTSCTSLGCITSSSRTPGHRFPPAPSSSAERRRRAIS